MTTRCHAANQQVLFADSELEAVELDDEATDDEVNATLFQMYCSALTMYSREKALLIMLYVTSRGRIFQAVEMHTLGASSQAIADELGSTHTTILRWLKRPLPRRPEWLDEALEELEEYSPDELREQLEADGWDAWMGGFRLRRIVKPQQSLFEDVIADAN